MNIEQFILYVDEVKKEKPIWFGLESDPVCSWVDIERLESRLLIQLPSDYKDFLLRFGGGYFALTNIYSGTNGSEWNLFDRNGEIGLLENNGFLAISENGMGDYYGFKIENKICGSEIFFFDHEDGTVKSTLYRNLFDYLVIVGLSN